MRPRGFWQDLQNVKEFLTQYATSKGFDPLDKEKWAATSLAEFAQQPVSLRRRTKRSWTHSKILQGASGLVKAYGTMRAALETAFPAVEFDFPGSYILRNPISTSPQKGGKHSYWPSTRIHIIAPRKHRPYDFWESIENRQNFFIEFATRTGFDHANPDNWTTITREQVIAEMVKYCMHPYTLTHIM